MASPWQLLTGLPLAVVPPVPSSLSLDATPGAIDVTPRPPAPIVVDAPALVQQTVAVPNAAPPAADADEIDDTVWWIGGGVAAVAIVGIGVAVVAASKKRRNPSSSSTRRNPLPAGYSRAAVRRKVRKLRREGRSPAQAAAIALRSARADYKRRHPRGRLPAHLKKGKR